MIKFKNEKPLTGYRVWLQFEDGAEGVVDLSHLKGKGVFALWNEENRFEKLFIHKESGARPWSDKVEICADALYQKISGEPKEKILSKFNQPYHKLGDT